MSGAGEKPAGRQRYGHWGQYWASGHLTSLPREFRVNYDGPIADFWCEQFNELPDPADILDLCSGNGAVAVLAAGHARDARRQARIHAIDAARIDPEAAAAAYPEQRELLQLIEFHGETPVEDTPFPDLAFDLVTSQYCIEYCDWVAAARQVARVLRPEGRLVLVTHTVDSDLFVHMAVIEEEYVFLDTLGFFPAIRDYLLRNMAFHRFNRLLRHAETEATALQARHQSPFLSAVLGMLREVTPMNKAQLNRDKPRLRSFYREFTAARARQNDMLRVNRLLAENPDWYTVFIDAGLALEDSGRIAYTSSTGRRTLEAGDYFCFTKSGGKDS